MAQQNQPKQEYDAREAAAKLRAQRRDSMQETSLKASQAHSPQITPSNTPSKKDFNSYENPNGNLSEPVRGQLNAPPEQTQPSSKTTLQDAQTIGQSLKSQGVTSNEVSQGNAKAAIENSFDTSKGTGSTSTQAKPLSETAKVTAQARQAVQKDENKSQSMER